MLHQIDAGLDHVKDLDQSLDGEPQNACGRCVVVNDLDKEDIQERHNTLVGVDEQRVIYFLKLHFCLADLRYLVLRYLLIWVCCKTLRFSQLPHDDSVYGAEVFDLLEERP